jgi:hypothetical protein
MNNLVIHGHNGGTVDFTLNGKRTIGSIGTDLDKMRETIVSERKRALETLARMDRWQVVTDELDRQHVADKVARRLAANAKSAATRAHNKDPFGFEAMRARS